MGSFHGAEVCDLVGLYILSKLFPIVGAPNIGLYRDDGLGVIKQSFGSTLEKIKKTIISEMLKIGFDIIINIGNTSTGFLDVTLDQSSNIFCPFKKPDSKTCYISNRSNHTKILEKISQI